MGNAGLDMVSGKDLVGPAQCAAHHLADIDQACIGLERARFQPRHVEQIGDEAIQPFRFFLDCRQKFVAVVKRQFGKGGKAVGGAKDRGKGRAQIMRD
jgi:hypothetical protein